MICFDMRQIEQNNLKKEAAKRPKKIQRYSMMMLARKQQGVKAEKLLDVSITKIAGLIAPYLKLDKLKRNKLQRALDIAGLELTPEIYTARACTKCRKFNGRVFKRNCD